MLEQEYMNVDDQEESPAHSQDQENNSKSNRKFFSQFFHFQINESQIFFL